MPRRRAVGRVFRRRRTGVGADGKPRTGYYPGFYIRLRRDGRELRQYAGPDRETALEVLGRLRRERARLELLDEEPQREIAFEVFAETYLTWSERAHTESTYHSRRSMIRNLLVPEFKGLRLDRITPPKIVRFLARRRADVGGATCNRNLAILSSIFQRATKLGLLRENPAQRIQRDREASTPMPLLGHDEQDRLIDELPVAMQPFFLTALHTGLRLGELMRLEWSDVELATGRIRVRISKNKRTRMVHATSRVLERLMELHTNRVLPLRGPDLVFPAASSRTSKPWSIAWSHRKAYRQAAAKIGRPELRVHDLRHLCAINLVRSGMDLPSVQAVLGHTSLLSTLRYAAYQDDTAAARAAALLDGMSRR